jgi:hypothetical protein
MEPKFLANAFQDLELCTGLAMRPNLVEGLRLVFHGSTNLVMAPETLLRLKETLVLMDQPLKYYLETSDIRSSTRQVVVRQSPCS